MVGACYMHAFVEQGHSLVGLCDLQPSDAVVAAVQAAIAAGSTMVRIGTAIFGARDYSKK